jgi:hypothetical protein
MAKRFFTGRVIIKLIIGRNPGPVAGLDHAQQHDSGLGRLFFPLYDFSRFLESRNEKHIAPAGYPRDSICHGLDEKICAEKNDFPLVSMTGH